MEGFSNKSNSKKILYFGLIANVIRFETFTIQIDPNRKTRAISFDISISKV